jgi:hypothetical protein
MNQRTDHLNQPVGNFSSMNQYYSDLNDTSPYFTQQYQHSNQQPAHQQPHQQLPHQQLHQQPHQQLPHQQLHKQPNQQPYQEVNNYFHENKKNPVLEEEEIRRMINQQKRDKYYQDEQEEQLRRKIQQEEILLRKMQEEKFNNKYIQYNQEKQNNTSNIDKDNIIRNIKSQKNVSFVNGSIKDRVRQAENNIKKVYDNNTQNIVMTYSSLYDNIKTINDKIDNISENNINENNSGGIEKLHDILNDLKNKYESQTSNIQKDIENYTQTTEKKNR